MTFRYHKKIIEFIIRDMRWHENDIDIYVHSHDNAMVIQAYKRLSGQVFCECSPDEAVYHADAICGTLAIFFDGVGYNDECVRVV